MCPRAELQGLHGQNQGSWSDQHTRFFFRWGGIHTRWFWWFPPQNGTADAASMPADDIYAAGLCHGLELAAGESHNGAGESHFSWDSRISRSPVLLHDPLRGKLIHLPSRWHQLLRGGDGPPLLLRPVPAGDARTQLLSPGHTHHGRVDRPHRLPGQHLTDQCRGAVQLPQG